MVQQRIRWGIMGCGFISGDFVEAIKLLPASEHEIVAVGSKDKSRAEEFKKKHELSCAVAYGSYDEFVKDANIDIVYVGTRNNQHMDDVIRCANAKKNILCEKPMGLNLAEVKKMYQVAKQNNVFLQEAFWSRFFPIYKDIRKIINDGIIGDVQVVQASLGFPILEKMERLYKPELGGGMALDLGCYLVQFALMVFGKGKKIEKVCANGWTKHSVDDTGVFVVKFEGCKIASLVYTGTTVLKCGAEICGTKGRIEIPSDMNAPDKYSVTVMENDKECTKNYSHERPKGDLSKFHFPTSNGLAFEADGVRKHLLTG
uniref:Trans-1,2-dihydrobenzene-1,2-diol dehydrogenase n=1 Tax=Syphacia muris TaxID=451379 RepID=A0A0N5ABG9_9BILA